MIPTLYVGDFILVNKFAYGFKIPFTEWCEKGGLSFCEGPVYFGDQELPKRGDIIVFKYPVREASDPVINYIKRVAGLPGDTIDIRDRVLYVNGHPVEKEEIINQQILEDLGGKYNKDYLQLFKEKLPVGKVMDKESNEHIIMHDMANTFMATWREGPQTVPKGYLFMMGDNRDFSHDSRAWGFVPLSDVKGRAVMIWFSFVPWWSDHGFAFYPERIGTFLN